MLCPFNQCVGDLERDIPDVDDDKRPPSEYRDLYQSEHRHSPLFFLLGLSMKKKKKDDG